MKINNLSVHRRAIYRIIYANAIAPSTPEKRTFQLCLDTRIDITAPLGDDGSDTTAHSCSVVASAATSTVHHNSEFPIIPS